MKNFLRWHLRDWFFVTFAWAVMLANHARAVESVEAVVETNWVYVIQDIFQ